MRPRILVLDEMPEMHRFVRLLFRRDAVTILSAFRPIEALAIAVDHAPDVLLLDLDLLCAEGLAMCEQLDTDPRAREISAVFITKPFDPDDLYARVRTALREKRERDALQADAELDPLSGIGNRRAFERHLAARVTAQRTMGEHGALIFVELDRGAMNDRETRAAIQTTAAVVSATIRSGDTAFRIGDEKLAILLAGTGLQEAQCFAERLRRRLACVDMEEKGSPLKISASFAVTATSQFRGRSLSGEAMTIAADEALYRAKDAGRDCIVIDPVRIRAS